MKLNDVRRRFPVDDRAAYERAYAEAELAGRLGELVQRLRTAAGLTERELADRMGVDEEELVLVEEGGPGVTVAFFDRLGRALGARIALAVDELGARADLGEAVEIGFGTPGGEPPARDG